MAHFAELDENNVVLRVIVVNDDYEADGENWCNKRLGGEWKQTSYNTEAGVHYAPNSSDPDGGVAFRKNYAGQGFTYNPTLDGFISPKPFNSWTLDEDTCQWEPPTPRPGQGMSEAGYFWNESTQSWDSA